MQRKDANILMRRDLINIRFPIRQAFFRNDSSKIRAVREKEFFAVFPLN